MSNQEYREKEVELRDYLNVVIKRKKIILTVFFISIIVTTIISFMMPKTYLSTAVIQDGVIEEPLFKKSETEQMVKFYDFLNPIVQELKIETNAEELKGFIKIESIKNTDFFELKVEYKNKDISLELCKSIANAFLIQANNIYLERVNLVKHSLAELDKQAESVHSDIKRTQELIDNLSMSQKIAKTETVARIILLQNTLPNYYTNFLSLLNQRDVLQLSLVKAKEFKLIELVESEAPIKPNKKLNIAISAIVSLIFGAFLAFFVEYWEKQK